MEFFDGTRCCRVNWPKISVVTPSYNQGQFLEKTILSVINQHYPNLEYIIIDGGSTDDSVEIIKKYRSHLKYWVSEPDRGQSHAINKGFEHAAGDLLAWLNADDYYMDGALQTVAGVFADHPDAGAFVGAGQMVDSAGHCLYYKEPEDVTFQGLFRWGVEGLFTQPSCFFKRSIWLQCGPLDESLHFTMDVDLWLKIARRSHYVRCRHLWSTTLIHDLAKTRAFQDRTMVDLAVVMMRHGAEKEARQILDNLEKRLSSAEDRLNLIRRNRLYRLTKPFIAPFLKRLLRTKHRVAYGNIQNLEGTGRSEPRRA